jgi:hypothetical protein
VAERPPDVLGDPTVQPFDRRDEHIVEEATGQRSVIDVDVDVPWSIGMPRTASAALPYSHQLRRVPRHASGSPRAPAPTIKIRRGREPPRRRTLLVDGRVSQLREQVSRVRVRRRHDETDAAAGRPRQRSGVTELPSNGTG